MPQSVTNAINAFARGEILVVTDDDDRENEGDLIVAASLCTPEKMAFIVRHTSGIVCAPLPASEAQRLHLTPMVAVNDAPLATAFTVSVDVKHGLTTGISAEERTNSVRALANSNMGASDFVRPGHVFPLVAKEGGVLIRSGHTEAAVDLCRLAKLPPVGVISELVNDDGTVMRGPQVADFAQKHGLQSVSIADLIAYRQAREKLVTQISTFPVSTEFGFFTAHAYVTPFDPVQHFALIYGEIGNGEDVLVRLQRADIVSDVFQGGGPLRKVMQRIATKGRGVLVYLREGTAGVPVSSQQETPSDSEMQRLRQWREIGLGAQILRDLGVVSIRNLTSSPRAYVGLHGFGLQLLGNEPVLDETVA
jgi:3,4-dihydroxy 2-butanone 4-phosphate synthase / GTP cyclohydrolase II